MNDYLFTDINNLNYIILAIYVLLIVYIVFILPNLNKETITFFDNLSVKLVTLFIIIYISISNPILAILLSLALVLTLQELNKQTVGADILDYELEEDLEDTEDINVYNTINKQNISKTLLKNDIVGNFSLDASSDSQKLISKNLNGPPINKRVLDSVPAHPSLKSLDRQLEKGFEVDMRNLFLSSRVQPDKKTVERFARYTADKHGHNFTKITADQLKTAAGETEEEKIQNVVEGDGVYLIGDAIIKVTGGVPKLFG